MHNRTEEKEIINHARKITKHFGTSYYFATWFFPKTIREYAWIMYSFYRHPDELVDNSSKDNEEQELSVWMKEWESAKKEGKSDNIVIQGALITHTKYDIPFSYSDTFLEAMKMDLSIKRYDTYESLKKYMYGSASVVGITMTYIMKGDQRTFPYAEKLGYAMQLTNFLRDIREDYEMRDRIYIPQNEMEAYGITEVDIQNHVYNQSFIELLKFQIQRTKDLYTEAQDGIYMLPKNVRLPILLASNLYQEIAHKIEEREYDIWTERVHTTTLEKLVILIKTLWQLKK